jgi:hypothetical protein
MHKILTCLAFYLVLFANVVNEVVAQQSNPTSWTLTFHYGGGTPNDAGPLGHCTATFTSDGKVRIESKGRQGVAGPRDLVVYETDSLERKQLEAIKKTADAALKEKPFVRRGANEDGHFLRLERAGNQPVQVAHNEMDDFSDAPPSMLEFVKLINELLPEKEQMPLKKNVRSR